MCPKCRQLKPDIDDIVDHYQGKASLWFWYMSLMSFVYPPPDCLFEVGYFKLIHEWAVQLTMDDPLLLNKKMQLLWTFLLKRGGPNTRRRTAAFLSAHCSGERPIEGLHLLGYMYHYGPGKTILWTPGEREDGHCR